MKKLGNTEKNIIEKVDKETGEVTLVTSSGLKFIPRSGWKLQHHHLEKIEGPSMTVQKQAFNIRDLLVRSSRGLDLVTEYQGLDLGEQDFDDPDFAQAQRMDIFDQQQLLSTAKNRIAETEKKITKKREETEQLRKGVPKGESVPPSTPPTATTLKE